MATGSSVFISYATDTKSRAQELTQALENQGIDAWVDFKDLRPGQRWRDELDRAIASAAYFLILVGTGSRSTAWQEAEWSAALAGSWSDKDKHLLPVIFGEAEPPAFLRDWASLRVDPDKEPSTWTHHVLDALRSIRNDAAHDVGDQTRRLREKRFDEISKVVEVLRRESPDEPPISAKTRSE